MDNYKFVLFGEDKKTLGNIKNALTSCGHVFTGYSKETVNILRHVRSQTPDLIIMDVTNNFSEIRSVLEVIDEEIISACLLILDTRHEEVFEFLKKTRVLSYVAKPVFNELIIQIVDILMMNFNRVIDYEKKVKELHETIESRKIIEKAKWLLVEQQKITENEAYEQIRKKSRDKRITMTELAKAIIIAHS